MFSVNLQYLHQNLLKYLEMKHANRWTGIITCCYLKLHFCNMQSSASCLSVL
jgi:hypothetical protein